MRLPRLPLVLLAIAVSICVAPSAARAAEAMRLDDPITDNYKASYNADPSAPENRTWLSIRAVRAAGTTWEPAEPAQIVVTNGGSIALTGADGRSATLRTQLTSGPFAGLLVRSDPTSAESGGRWGPLATLTDRAALKAAPGRFALTLTGSDGEVLATGVVSYRYDPALANAPESSIEHNGPGGRWWVGSTRTRTNWEPVPATAPSVLAAEQSPASSHTSARPRIVRIRVPRRTTMQVVTMRVEGRNAGGVRITRVRVRLDAGRWSSWLATRAAYGLRLGEGARVHTVRVQLRDAQGRTSLVASRRIRSLP